MPADADARTEPPTQRRRDEARKKGQTAKSQDLTGAVVLFAAFVALNFLGPGMFKSMMLIVRAGLLSETPGDLGSLMPFAAAVVVEAFKRVAPFLVILFLAVLAVLYAQVGNVVTLQPLKPNLSKINPLKGIARLFSTRSVMMAVQNIWKLALVSLVVYLMLAHTASPVIYAFTLGFPDAFWLGSSLAFNLGMELSAVLLVLALLDLAWQRYKHEKDMRMTKEEVKDEFRSMEGDPKVKSRRRELQYRLALQRIRRDVPKADVVVTNPTHVAVAIQYDAEAMPAPKVVAKGADELALRIRQIATEHRIPIVERKALARALYETVDVGQYLPERFYRAIAEILAYVYELTGRSPIGVQGSLVGG
ncbi:MAG: flagellar biosynthesis protein FlhB [Phycisphaerales bacterium]|nr:MAG: flagellar biosynthesis protein FlhB [Phycisphaerales bacterium]